MRRRTSGLAVALLLASAVGVAAAMVTPDLPLPLEGTAWRLTNLPGRTLLVDHAATLRFEKGRVLGTDGCNRYTAPYSADAKGFRLSGPAASTKIACPPPVMEQADAFLDALSRARALRREGDALALLDAGGAVLATLEAQSQTLPGSAWRVTGYNNGKQAVVGVLHDSALSLEFSADGRVSGSAGCNRYTASWTTTGQGLSIGPAAATKKLCARPEGVMEQEAAFLSALEGVAVARIDGDRLELRSAAGSLMVSARRDAGDAGAAGATSASGTAAPADASLTNTYWRIVRLGDRPVSAVEGRREPHLVLRAEGDRTGYAATVGCNQLVGGCAIDGGTIRFTPGAATLMACPPPLEELERSLGEALEAARRWRIAASTLELLDESGGSVARFESVLP